MNKQKILINDFYELFIILDEIKDQLNLDIQELSKEKNLKKYSYNKEKYLIFNRKNFSNKLPIKISKLVEKFNVEFLKLNFNYQSEIKLNKYKINLNSRELESDGIKLKLTEKESNIIIYLSKYAKPITINELQLNVWGYQSDLETHTVETHIYRLRKKILKFFSDDNFIVSKKNGYQIN